MQQVPQDGNFTTAGYDVYEKDINANSFWQRVYHGWGIRKKLEYIDTFLDLRNYPEYLFSELGGTSAHLDFPVRHCSDQKLLCRLNFKWVPIAWPLHSPDLRLCQFFLAAISSIVYALVSLLLLWNWRKRFRLASLLFAKIFFKKW